jgi:hypothetical protein
MVHKLNMPSHKEFPLLASLVQKTMISAEEAARAAQKRKDLLAANKAAARAMLASIPTISVDRSRTV